MAELLIGVDLGGTQIRALLVDGQGKALNRASTLTRPDDGLEAIIRRIEDTVRRAVGNIPWGQIRGIGVGAPGPVDPWTGVVVGAPNLPGWQDVPLRDIMAETFGLPVCLGNDANLAALAEHTYGAGVGVDHMIYMTISTGIGGGIIVNGELLLGAGGLAGEIGHQTLVDDGPLCGCGNRGHLESLASGPAIARAAREEVARGHGRHILQLARGVADAIDARIVAQAASDGDPTAEIIIRRAATYVGIGLANLCNILNPELIILGGGVTRVGHLLFDTVRETVAERAMSGARQVRIVPAALADDVVLLGAVALIETAGMEGGNP
jgi:glucokinase